MNTPIDLTTNTPNIFFLIIIILSILLLLFSISTVFMNNLIYSVFSLIFYFISGIWFFAFFRAEYTMVLFIIIYLGAIVVFFLFVLMLIDKQYWNLSTKSFSNNIQFYMSLTSFIFFVSLFISFCSIFFTRYLVNGIISLFTVNNYANNMLNSSYNYFTNAEKIGFLLYSEYGILLIIGGVILLIAILGCVLIIRPTKLRK